MLSRNHRLGVVAVSTQVKYATESGNEYGKVCIETLDRAQQLQILLECYAPQDAQYPPIGFVQGSSLNLLFVNGRTIFDLWFPSHACPSCLPQLVAGTNVVCFFDVPEEARMDSGSI